MRGGRSDLTRLAHNMITDAQLMKALTENGGDFALTAKAIGTSYQNVHQRVGRSAKLQAHCLEVERLIVGAAKGVLIEAIVKKKSERWSAWWLERKDRSNFSMRTELTGANGQAIAIAPQKIEVEVRYVNAPATEPEEEPPI